jgi:hypothetical protein
MAALGRKRPTALQPAEVRYAADSGTPSTLKFSKIQDANGQKRPFKPPPTDQPANT